MQIAMFIFHSMSFNSCIDLTSRCVSIQQPEYVFILSALVFPKLHHFFFPSCFQFLSTSTTGPHWWLQTAAWCFIRLMRFWKRQRTSRQTCLDITTRHCWDRLEDTCQYFCPSLWCHAQEKGPSSVCCSCWGLCGWVTPSTSSRGGNLTQWTLDVIFLKYTFPFWKMLMRRSG